MPLAAQNILIIGHVWPEPLATAAGKRMLQLLECLKGFGYQITFASAAEKSDYSLDLNALGIDQESILLNDSSFDLFIEKLSPKIVIFDRFMTEEQYGWRVSEVLPHCLQILNTEDLHSLRAARARCLKEGLSISKMIWLNDDMTKRELASIYRSDLSLIISRAEMKLLIEEANIPEELLFYLPFLVDSEAGDPVSFEERSDFVFLGNGKHRPNVDAINWLYQEIWPIVHKELPNARLHIYGAYLSDAIMSLNQPEIGFMVHGWTKSSSDVFSRARINLVPLRFGAGLKGKLVEAMVSGTPSIATSIAVEGIYDLASGSSGKFDDAAEFAAEAVSSYTDKETWLRKQLGDKEILRSEFNSLYFSKQLKEQLQVLMHGLEEHRLGNTVGKLLRHHSAASTKYMSKWIELKNKKSDPDS